MVRKGRLRGSSRAPPVPGAEVAAAGRAGQDRSAPGPNAAAAKKREQKIVKERKSSSSLPAPPAMAMAAGGREPGERGRQKARGGASSRPPRPSPPALRRGPRTIPQAVPQAKAVPRAQAVPQAKAIPQARLRRSPGRGARTGPSRCPASGVGAPLEIRNCPHSCSGKDFRGRPLRGPRRGARGAPSQG